MSSCSNLSLWRLSIYTAAITAAAGIVGSIEPPAVAQPGLCRTVDGTSLANVPASVKAAASKAVVPLKVVQLNNVDVDDGMIVYELGGVQKNGCPFEVEVFKSGKLDRVEYQLPSLNSLPQAARATLNSKVPGYKVTFVEKIVTSGGGVGFELEGGIKGKTTTVGVTADGKFILLQSPEAFEIDDILP